MSTHVFKIRVALLVGLLAALAGCQDYSFEEVTSATIKEKRMTYNITVASAVDILFVVDNSGSMVGEQRQLAESFEAFSSTLETYFGDDYHIAVVTTSMESPFCPPCDVYPSGCINETGETGRFQDRIGKIAGGTDDNPLWEHRRDEYCRVVTPDNKHCFYDPDRQEGIALVGTDGCGYERGLAPMKRALQPDLLQTYNRDVTNHRDFLREHATLAVIVISDEEDCGEVGDITEGLVPGQGDVCYYAAKGVGPENTYSHPNDPDGKPYRLTGVEDYYDFLMGLKNNKEGMVKFAAIVGVGDAANPAGTSIEYEWDASDERYRVSSACITSGCEGRYCYSQPGTRYLELARMFDLDKKDGNGFIDTICQESFIETMQEVGQFVACPRLFKLSDPILDPSLASILINGEPIPRYSCDVWGQLIPCADPADICSEGESCVKTWSYNPPDEEAQNGTITFADHYDPCELFEDGEQVHIEVVYVVP